MEEKPHFLTLPREIRDMIYDYAVGLPAVDVTTFYEIRHSPRNASKETYADELIRRPHRQPSLWDRKAAELILTCLQIHSEAMPVLWANTTFIFASTEHLLVFLLKAKDANLVSRIRLNESFDDYRPFGYFKAGVLAGLRLATSQTWGLKELRHLEFTFLVDTSRLLRSEPDKTEIQLAVQPFSRISTLKQTEVKIVVIPYAPPYHHHEAFRNERELRKLDQQCNDLKALAIKALAPQFQLEEVVGSQDGRENAIVSNERLAYSAWKQEVKRKLRNVQNLDNMHVEGRFLDQGKWEQSTFKYSVNLRSRRLKRRVPR